MINTPTKPANTALQRRRPTFSRSNRADIAVTNNGAVNTIATTSASGSEATKKKLCFLVDFQTRANEFYVEAVKRIHSGAIGDMVFGESAYHTGRLGIKAEPGTPESRLKNWVFDKALSGDIITEQNIHTLDVMSWIMNAPPLHVTGTGGRKVRTDVGNLQDRRKDALLSASYKISR